MQPDQKTQSSSGAPASFFGPFNPAIEYMLDAAQRSVLFFDVMRQRGNHIASKWHRRCRMCSTTMSSWSWMAALRAPGQLRPGPGGSAARRRDRSKATAIRRRRSARRAWPGHRRFQGGQRNRCRAQGRTSLLFHRLPAGSDAGPDHRRHRPRRSGVPRESRRAASRGRRQALRVGNCQAGWAVMMLAAMRPDFSDRSSSPARRYPTGRAYKARIRCAIAAACLAAVG